MLQSLVVRLAYVRTSFDPTESQDPLLLVVADVPRVQIRDNKSQDLIEAVFSQIRANRKIQNCEKRNGNIIQTGEDSRMCK
jgi:hypothetical protein